MFNSLVVKEIFKIVTPVTAEACLDIFQPVPESSNQSSVIAEQYRISLFRSSFKELLTPFEQILKIRIFHRPSLVSFVYCIQHTSCLFLAADYEIPLKGDGGHCDSSLLYFLYLMTPLSRVKVSDIGGRKPSHLKRACRMPDSNVCCIC